MRDLRSSFAERIRPSASETEIGLQLTALEKSLAPLLEALRGVETREQSTSQVTTCAPDLAPLFRELAEQLDDCDTQTQETLATIRGQFAESHGQACQLDELESQLGGYDFTGAQQTLGPLMKTLNIASDKS